MLRLRERELISFDFETTGLRPYHGDRPFAYSIGFTDGSSVVQRGDIVSIKNYLRPGVSAIAHNLKFELSMLSVTGIGIPEDVEWHDTMIQAKLLRNLAVDITLDGLCWELCRYPRDIDLKVKSMAKAFGGRYDRVPKGIMEEYQRADAERAILLHLSQYPIIEQDPKLLEIYRREIELIHVTQRMEQAGFLLDVEETERILSQCERNMEGAERALVEMEGEYYNIGSDEQMRRLVFGKYKLPIIGYTKKAGKPSLDKDTLSELREKHPHPIIDIIQKYRGARKGHGILSGYLKLKDSRGYIHPSIKTNHADTGREACEQPNLQNVSKKENLKNPYIVSGRSCFRGDPGYYLFDVDQSGIELRLIIEAAGSEKMIEIIRNGGHPHLVACKLFFGDRFRSKQQDKPLYDTGKNGHFCLCYGGGLEKFAETIGMSIAEARPGFEAYQGEFPEIAYLSGTGISRAKREGEIRTAFGRRLRLPSGKYYSWLNYFIQGTAAEIIKRGQIRVDQYFREHFPVSAHLCLTVHDSIMFQVRKDVWDRSGTDIIKNVNNLMTNFKEISVPLEVEWKVSEGRWDEAKDLEI